jgi:hypothetical protein
MLGIVQKSPEYVYNHCTKALARDAGPPRHAFLGLDTGDPRGRISEAWRFPVVDAHDGTEPDHYEWNDVTFVYADGVDGRTPPVSVALLTTAHALHEPLPMPRVEDSIFRACTLKIRKGTRYRYRLLLDGSPILDPINPQLEVRPTGDRWSSFFTWTYNQPISFERWEFALLDRLVRHILPFNSPEARNFLARGANAGTVGHLYRLDVSVGVANYIDKLVAREERHHRSAYETCLEDDAFEAVYDQMARNDQALFNDGWDPGRYQDPSYFLWLLRRHAWTGAFAHPKWGGNPGGMAWNYLSERFTGDDGRTAFAWKRAIEPPLGESTEYAG